MKKEIKKAFQLVTLIIIVFGLSLSLQSIIAQTWIAPESNPPIGGVGGIINTSSSTQAKAGDLGIAGDFYVGDGEDADALFVDQESGNVGIGNTDPNAGLDVDGNFILRDFTDCGRLFTDVNGEVQCGTYASTSGDITAVIAGDGLQGGGNSGDVTINFDCSDVAGSGLSCSGEDLYITTGGVTGSMIENDTITASDIGAIGACSNICTDNAGITSETDPYVDTVSSSGNNWCRGNSSSHVQCNYAAPTFALDCSSCGTCWKTETVTTNDSNCSFVYYRMCTPDGWKRTSSTVADCDGASS